MRHIACQNEECANKGAPYFDYEDELVVVVCPLCGKAMAKIPTPEPTPTVASPEEEA
jgi:hypothetical protein